MTLIMSVFLWSYFMRDGRRHFVLIFFFVVVDVFRFVEVAADGVEDEEQES